MDKPAKIMASIFSPLQHATFRNMWLSNTGSG